MGKGKDIPRDLTDRALGRALGRKIARLERHVRELEVASQAAHRSVEDGAIDVYDDNDVLRERIGKQADGSFGRLTVDGPVPPAPTEPDVVVIDNGVVAITWDGRCEEKWPFAEFRNVRVHMDDTEDFTPDRDNQVGSIHAHRGGTIVAVTESDDDNPIWVRLVAVSTAGHTSDPSPSVLVDELDEDDLEDEPEELEWEDGDGRPITQAEVDAGQVVLALSHDPEVESLTAVLAGAPQRADKFTIDYDAQTLTLPLGGWEETGDVLWVHYAYMSGSSILVPFESSGWSFKQVPLADTTDRSAVGFDDSAWSVAAAAFGHDPSFAEFPAPTTNWDEGSVLWLRRTVPATPGRALLVRLRVDNYGDLYWNGTKLHEQPRVINTSTVVTVTIPAEQVLASNVIAIRAEDPAGTEPNASYADAQIEEL